MMLNMMAGHSGGEAVVALLVDQEAWRGGFYELAIQLGAPDDARLGVAVRMLASAACIEGPWLLDGPLGCAEAASWTVADLSRGHLRGLVRLPGGQQTLCSVIAVREDEGEDWLDLCLPLEALSRCDSRVGAFPFGEDGGEGSLVWRRPIDDWLAGIARRVGQAAGFAWR